MCICSVNPCSAPGRRASSSPVCRDRSAAQKVALGHRTRGRQSVSVSLVLWVPRQWLSSSRNHSGGQGGGEGAKPALRDASTSPPWGRTCHFLSVPKGEGSSGWGRVHTPALGGSREWPPGNFMWRNGAPEPEKPVLRVDKVCLGTWGGSAGFFRFLSTSTLISTHGLSMSPWDWTGSAWAGEWGEG